MKPILDAVAAIPGDGPVLPGRVLALVKGSGLSPEEVLLVLGEASRRVRSSVKNPRSWCLSALKTPAFAKDLLMAVRLQSPGDVLREAVGSLATQVLETAPGGIQADLLPHLADLVTQKIAKRLKVRNPIRLATHMLKHLEPSDLSKARRAMRHAATKGQATPSTPWWEMRKAVVGWMDVADPYDPAGLAWIESCARARGWADSDLRSLPELKPFY